MLVVYVAILAYGLNEFRKTPVGFIPQVDRGYLILEARALFRCHVKTTGGRDHQAL